MDGADYRPFASDLDAASQQKLAEAAGLLDLAEDRLDSLFAQAVGTVEAVFAQLGAHLLDPGAWLAGRAAVGGRLTMALSARGDEGVDLLLVQGLQVGVGAVAGVGGKLRGIASGVGADGLDHRLELAAVGRAIAEPVGDDDLRLGVDC